MATPLTYNAPRTKLQPVCLLAKHGIKPTTTDSDILNNYASKLAENILQRIRHSMTDTNRLSHRPQIPLYFLLSKYSSHYRLSFDAMVIWHPSIHHKPNIFCYPDCSYTCACTCLCVCVTTRPTLAALRFTALDSQSSAKRTQTITTLPQFICHGSLTSFNCQA